MLPSFFLPRLQILPSLSGTPTEKLMPASFIPSTTSFAFSGFMNIPFLLLTYRFIEKGNDLSVFPSPLHHVNNVQLSFGLNRPFHLPSRCPAPLSFHHDFTRLLGKVIIHKESSCVRVRRPRCDSDDRRCPHDCRIHKDKIDRRSFGLDFDRVMDIAIDNQIMLSRCNKLRHKGVRLPGKSNSLLLGQCLQEASGLFLAPEIYKAREQVMSSVIHNHVFSPPGIEKVLIPLRRLFGADPVSVVDDCKIGRASCRERV